MVYCQTYVYDKDKRDEVHRFIRKEILDGRQAFVVWRNEKFPPSETLRLESSLVKAVKVAEYKFDDL